MADDRDVRDKPAADKPRAAALKGDAGQAEVQERFDQEQEQGYRGAVPDATPNEHYTVEGVTSGKPTPETARRHPDRAED
jgi:hypothetical protein